MYVEWIGIRQAFGERRKSIMGFLSGLISAVTGVVETVVTSVATAIAAPTIGTVVAAVATVGVVAGAGYLIYKAVTKASDVAGSYIESKCNPDKLVQREVVNECGDYNSANGPYQLEGQYEHHYKPTAKSEDEYFTNELFNKYAHRREPSYQYSGHPTYEDDRFQPHPQSYAKLSDGTIVPVYVSDGDVKVIDSDKSDIKKLEKKLMKKLGKKKDKMKKSKLKEFYKNKEMANAIDAKFRSVESDSDVETYLNSRPGIAPRYSLPINTIGLA